MMNQHELKDSKAQCRAHYVNSNQLDWSSADALVQSWNTARQRSIQLGKRLVLTLEPNHYTVRNGMVYPKGSPLLVTQSHRLRIRYPNGSTKTIKDVMY